MTPDVAEGYTTVLGKILLGNMLGAMTMIAVLILFVLVIRRLWSMIEGRMAECERQHNECQKENAALSAALIDLVDGKKHEARGRIETMLNYRNQQGTPSAAGGHPKEKAP